MRFADIIGNGSVAKALASMADSGRVAHAMLLYENEGSGALALAMAYLQYLNCANRHNGDSCGECPSCRKIAALAHPDLHFVFPVNKQGKKSGEVVRSDDFIEDWREIVESTGGYFSAQEWFDRLDLGKTLKGMISAKETDEIIRKLSFKSFEAEYKTMIIWLPETMNEEAANKILKILEEPWDKTLFILITERADRLLQTILSRTQEVAVPRLQPEVLESVVRESGESDEAKVRNIARLANGDLCELRRLMAGAMDDVRHESFEMFCALMRFSYNDRHLELITWAEELAQLTREQQLSFLRHSARLLRESYVMHAGAMNATYLWGEEAAFCNKFAPYINSRNIEPLIGEIEMAMAQIGQNGNPKIVFTHFALAVSKYIARLQ